MPPTLPEIHAQAEPQGSDSGRAMDSGCRRLRAFWSMHIVTCTAFGAAGHLSAPGPANIQVIGSFIWLSFLKHFLTQNATEASYNRDPH